MKNEFFKLTPSDNLAYEIQRLARSKEGFERVQFYGTLRDTAPYPTLTINCYYLIKEQTVSLCVSANNVDTLIENFKEKLKATFEPEFENVENF